MTHMFSRRALPALALVLVLVAAAPAVSSAQTITTTPSAVVPVAGPVGLVLMTLLLLGGSAWLLARRGTQGVQVAGVALVAATVIGSGLYLAQATATFTNPAGETLAIPVTPIGAQGNVAGWEWVDYTNDAGVPLAISDLAGPTFAQCFPGGLTGVLLPAGPPPSSPPAACSEGAVLADGAMCRVDVDALCRTAAAGQLATLSTIAPADGPAAGGTSVTLGGTNLTGATAVTFDGSAASSVTVVTATTVTAVTPAHAGGAVDVRISTPQGTALLPGGYTYAAPLPTLTAVAPSSGAASGQTGVTLTGTQLGGATGVTFDGIAATSVNVVDANTITAVTPAHVAGAVDVVVSTPGGNVALVNGYAYVPTMVGAPAAGGTIAALAGSLRNLVATVVDTAIDTEWGWQGTAGAIGPSAQSTTDGAANTAAIVATLGAFGGTPYAAQACTAHEVDSQGNTPCQPGNTCYNDWFLPAAVQLNDLYTNRVAIGGFANQSYWSSSESLVDPAFAAVGQTFSTGTQEQYLKSSLVRIRCVRAFTP